MFAYSCKQANDGGQKPTISNEITITIKGDDGVIVNELNTIKVKKSSTWKEIEQKAIKKITLKHDKDIKEWRIKNSQGVVLKDATIFEKDDVVFVVLKTKGEPEVPKITITVMGDDNVEISSPNTLVADKGAKWADIKVQVEGKTKAKENFEIDEWRFDNATGALLDGKVKLEESKTVFAVSKRKIVGYKVQHFQENIENDEYTLKETEEKEGEAGKETNAESKQYEGFSCQGLAQTTIKADGSTVIQIKYKRNHVSLILDLTGGSTTTVLEDGTDGKKLLKGKFEAKIEVKGLEKENHRFGKWKPALPEKFPATSLATTYTAEWVPKTVYRVNISGDERVEVAEPEYIDIPINTPKTIGDIRSEIVAKVSLKAGWSAKDYEFYDWRMGGETGEEMQDATQIVEDIAVYARTNYKRFKIWGTTLVGHVGEKPRGRIFLPKEITEIGWDAFNDCSSLESIDLSPCSKLTKIEEYTFSGCTKAVVKLPTSITEIKEKAFGEVEDDDIASWCKKVLVPNNEIKRLVIGSRYPKDRIEMC